MYDEGAQEGGRVRPSACCIYTSMYMYKYPLHTDHLSAGEYVRGKRERERERGGGRRRHREREEHTGMAFIRPVTTSTRSPSSTASGPSTRRSTILAWILAVVLYLIFAEFVSTCTPIHIHVNCIPRSKLIFANTWNPLPCSL